MIEGNVNVHLEAVVTLPLLGPEGQAREIDAVVDTGFNGYLILPPLQVVERFHFFYVAGGNVSL